MSGPLYIIVMGKQGSGKGTQCDLISEVFGMPHVSTGDILREAALQKNEIGVRVKATIDNGDLVDDETMCEIVHERLEQGDIRENGVLLDGFPRTSHQAEALWRILDKSAKVFAVNLDVPTEEVKKRLLKRGREDDTMEAIEKRLEIYEAETAPLLNWFEDHQILHRVDGSGSEEEVFGLLQNLVEKLKNPVGAE